MDVFERIGAAGEYGRRVGVGLGSAGFALVFGVVRAEFCPGMEQSFALDFVGRRTALDGVFGGHLPGCSDGWISAFAGFARRQ